MKMINFYVEHINENSNVNVIVSYFPETWKIQVIVEWDCNFTNKNYFDSIEEAKAYLRGLYDALPF